MRDSCSKMPFPNFPFQVFAKLIAAAMQARPGGLRVDAVRPFSCLKSTRPIFEAENIGQVEPVLLWNRLMLSFACLAALRFTKAAGSRYPGTEKVCRPGWTVPST